MTQLGELSLWIALLMAGWCATLATRARCCAAGRWGAARAGSTLARLHACGRGARLAFLATILGAVRRDALERERRDVLQGLRLLGGRGGSAAGRAGGGRGLRGRALVARTRIAARAAAWTVAVARTDRRRGARGDGVRREPVHARSCARPEDGRGLDPMLRHPLDGASATADAARRRLRRGAARDCGGGAGPPAVRRRAVGRDAFDGARIVGTCCRRRSSSGRAGRTCRQDCARWERGSPPVITCAVRVGWLLTLFLVVVEVRTAAAGTASEADPMRRRAGRLLVGRRPALCLVDIRRAAAARRNTTCRSRTATRTTRRMHGDTPGRSRARARAAWSARATTSSRVALMPTRDGVRQPFVASESRQYYGAAGSTSSLRRPSPGSGARSLEDLVVVLADAGEGRAALRIAFAPLVELSWIGGVLLDARRAARLLAAASGGASRDAIAIGALLAAGGDGVGHRADLRRGPGRRGRHRRSRRASMTPRRRPSAACGSAGMTPQLRAVAGRRDRGALRRRRRRRRRERRDPLARRSTRPARP